MGTAKWATTFATGLAGISEDYGLYEAGRGLADGQWEYSDVFNLLSLVPYAVPAVATVKNALGTIKAANRAAGGIADDAARATGSIDNVLRSSQKTEATVGGEIKDKVGDFEEASAGRRKQTYTPDLSHVTGKTARNRNRAIRYIIKEDLPNLNLTHTPEYSPFIGNGVAKKDVGTQIGKNSFSSRKDLRNTIVHEELHHRWWKRNAPRPHHSDQFIQNEKFYETIKRYERSRGWRNN